MYPVQSNQLQSAIGIQHYSTENIMGIPTHNAKVINEYMDRINFHKPSERVPSQFSRELEDPTDNKFKTFSSLV